MPGTAKDDLPSFKPTLISSPTKRKIAQSSGYGHILPHVPKREPAPRPEETSKELTFKPNLAVTEKVRKNITSTGYGKVTPEKKVVVRVDEPSFRPDTAVTARMRKKATSTGYGQRLVEKKKVDPEAYKPSFQPKLDFSKKGAILRKNVHARHLEERPRTAPADSRREDSPKAPLMHTLAADRGEPTLEEDIDGPSFVLDGSAFSKTPALLSKSAIDLTPPPLARTKATEKIMKQATPTGYGSTWQPPLYPAPAKEAEPVMHFSKAADTYIDRVEEIPVVVNKSTKAAMTTYPKDGYAPPVATGVRPALSEDGPRMVFGKAGDSLPPVDELPVVKNKLDHVASSGYGIVSPSAYDSAPRAEEANDGGDSSGSAVAARVAPPVAPKPAAADVAAGDAEEQTTIL